MINWKTLVSECLQERANQRSGKNAVAVFRTNSQCSDEVGGHVQQNISMIKSMFL